MACATLKEPYLSRRKFIQVYNILQAHALINVTETVSNRFMTGPNSTDLSVKECLRLMYKKIKMRVAIGSYPLAVIELIGKGKTK